MTFKEDFKPSRVYNKLVIDAINKDIAIDRSIIIPNTFDIDVKNNNKKYLCGTGRMECFDCLLYTSPSPRDPKTSRMPSSA